ncbi:hypothetical protein SLS62_003323 [Diatrype stigma]|uniref:Uncharacterized protein n=1 Tax=Diatrype stigma TaxID=117547 RepID=A0AAN9V754_9PEZI
MGLPLFVAPVESDIPSKPGAKNPADPAQSRSPIRRAPRSPHHRSERRRQLHETQWTTDLLPLDSPAEESDDTPIIQPIRQASTMTPDPQPPSVGSSFASTTASAAASRNTSANTSVNTSMTNPDEETEPPCDHEFDESENDEDAELRRTASSRRPTPPGRRSYADVAADLMFEPTAREEGNDRPDWLSGMHRIVRGLASRQDIPDEWWAEAGLNRSMRYEDSI